MKQECTPAETPLGLPLYKGMYTCLHHIYTQPHITQIIHSTKRFSFVNLFFVFASQNGKLLNRPTEVGPAYLNFLFAYLNLLF